MGKKRSAAETAAKRQQNRTEKTVDSDIEEEFKTEAKQEDGKAFYTFARKVCDAGPEGSYNNPKIVEHGEFQKQFEDEECELLFEGVSIDHMHVAACSLPDTLRITYS